MMQRVSSSYLLSVVLPTMVVGMGAVYLNDVVFSVLVWSILTAACTGLGGIPFLFVKRFSRLWMGVSNALASGLMFAASFSMCWEGFEYNGMHTCVGVLVGGIFLVLCNRWLSHDSPHGASEQGKDNPRREDQPTTLTGGSRPKHRNGGSAGEGLIAPDRGSRSLSPGFLRQNSPTRLSSVDDSLGSAAKNRRLFVDTSGSNTTGGAQGEEDEEGEEDEDAGMALHRALANSDTRKALLIVFVMTIHSFAEGVGVGVSFGGGEELGAFISSAIALHNVPEGLAIALVLIPRGTSPLGAMRWAVITSLPQAIMAVPAFLFVQTFAVLLPGGLGFAAGAMLWMVWSELFPQAMEDMPPALALTVALVTAVPLVLWQVTVGV